MRTGLHLRLRENLGQQVLSSKGFLKGERDPLASSIAEGGLDDGKRAVPTPLSLAHHLLLMDKALMEEAARFPVEGFSDKLSFPVCPLGGGSSSSSSSMSLDEGVPLGRTTDSLISWREQDVSLLVEDKGNVYRPVCMISDKGLVVEALENQPKVAKIVVVEASGEGDLEQESPFDLSYHKFISFSKFMGLSVNGNEKEIASLLRKMEPESGTKLRLRRGSPFPHPAWLGSFKIWNA